MSTDTPLLRLDDCPAPAKLNLFLHITGRRADGYHTLQTAFRLVDLADRLSFVRRDDGAIVRLGGLADVAADDDLVVRAARALQAAAGCRFGADIRVSKTIPAGGGLGGGSSDAATTLLALNRLWGLDYDAKVLASIGLTLGADVPFFIFGRDAFAEGIGERLQALPGVPAAHYLIIWPGVMVSTVKIFSSPALTRDSKPIKMHDFATDTSRNDMQPVACDLYEEIAQALAWLETLAPARMSGSGSCVFAPFAERADAEHALQGSLDTLPSHWSAWVASSLTRHPLYDWVRR